MTAETEQTLRENRYHYEVSDAQREFAKNSIPELHRVSSHQGIASYTLLDVLKFDARPSFVVDLSLAPPPTVPIDPIYCNPALIASPVLLGKIQERCSPLVTLAESNSGFRRWLFEEESEEKDTAWRGRRYVWEGHTWSATTIQNHRVVSGLAGAPLSLERTSSKRTMDPRDHSDPKNLPQMVDNHLPSVPDSVSTPGSQGSTRSSSTSQNQVGRFDYTTMNHVPEDLPDHLKYFHSVDWASTSIGPMKSWTPQLRCIVNIIMNDSYPALLLWGNDVTMIYNEAYIEIIGLLHPCMGRSARIAAADYWGYFQPLVDHINATGETLTQHDLPIFLDRHGFLEETYYSFQFIPILDSDGKVAGYYQPLKETTQNNILARRVSSLVEVGSQTAKARDLHAYWDLVVNTLVINDKDAPFALLYAVEHGIGQELSSMSSPGSSSEVERCVLKGSIGVDADHPIAPSVFNLEEGTSVFIPHLQEAIQSRRPTLVRFEDINLPETVLNGIKWKGYGDPCRAVVVCPLLPTTSEQILGFLILGVNPRRPFDVEYEQFVHVMNRLLGTSLAAVAMFAEEIRQKERAIGQAALIQEQLVAELSSKEKKFQRFAERSDVGIFILDPSGSYTYRNQRWFEIFKDVSEVNNVTNVWSNIVFPEDIAFCEGLFSKLVIEKTPISFELKTTMRWTPPAELPDPSNGATQEHFSWIICSAYPELNTDGELVEIVGNVTDISKQKWAEELQKMRTNSALESKHHLEHFIDTTSHEMRNPLSAIMQCADEILTSSCVERDDTCTPPSPESYADILEQTLDAAQTIAQCAQHMKRIVDDILTISKLDSGLLVITPVDAQPAIVVNHAVKMFSTEAKAAGIEMKLIIEESYHDLQVDWVSLDPTRLLQVLINLITNAVKFTRLEPIRHITISIGASATPPPSSPGGVQYIDTKLVEENSQLKDDWKHGLPFYLVFSVKDTGRGLAEEEKATLFARFSQASPRTHIHYGGSGLGLFISRRLTEMQGGAIGLASQYKKGSTFAFYIKTRRTLSDARRGSLPYTFPEDIRHRPNTPREIDRLLNPPKAFPLIRKSSVETAESPTASIGLDVPEPVFEELKRTKSIPDILHVLVVEDNLVNQKVLAKQLRTLGCEVNVANHGVEALDFLRKTKHWNQSHHDSSETSLSVHTPLELSLILMDWEMPIMNGLTCVSKIRELERAAKIISHIPVIGVTANVRQQQINMAVNAGMDDVVGKPFRVAELLGRMKDVIAGNVGIGLNNKNSGLSREMEGVKEAGS